MHIFKKKISNKQPNFILKELDKEELRPKLEEGRK